jgi:hypothetical protein
VVDVDELPALGVPIDQLLQEDDGRGVVGEPWSRPLAALSGRRATLAPPSVVNGGRSTSKCGLGWRRGRSSVDADGLGN